MDSQTTRDDVAETISTLRTLQAKGDIASFSINRSEAGPLVRLRTIMKGEVYLERLAERLPLKLDPAADTLAPGRDQKQAYYFFSQELRPGSGILRFVNGIPKGPGGTLSFMLSSRDGSDLYFAAAGHVVTNFWEEGSCDDQVSIYWNPKGFPNTNRSRFLGNRVIASAKPPNVYKKRGKELPGENIDIGIVELKGNFKPTQRTTCYGTFGEWAKGQPVPPYVGQRVIKCGAEEPHFTEAIVVDDNEEVVVYGPNNTLYRFSNQVILRSPDREEESEGPATPRKNSFAVSGDSGTIVVEKDGRRPVGMLIAGSVLDRLYVMTPFGELLKFLERMDLVLSRG